MKHSDLKTGLVLGLVLVIIVVIRLATDPRLSPEARMQKLHDVTTQEEVAASPNDFSQAELSENHSFPDDLEPDNPPPDDSTITDADTEQLSADNNQSEQAGSLPYVQTEKIITQRFHIVRKNQTLSSISKEYYGTTGKWEKIFNANRDVIKDANKIKPGTKLIIPD